MATKIYESQFIRLLDGREIYATPLKIKYLRDFMTYFEKIKDAGSDDEAIPFLVKCSLIAMKQYLPEINTEEKLEDVANLPILYDIIDIASGLKKIESSTNNKQESSSSASWEEFDLAKLEAELFQLGIWKDYEQLEESLSMPEIMATLESKRELDYAEKKFFAAIQGVDLDKESGNKNAWEEMKARVFSNGQASDSNDILAYQGPNATKAGFGIGAGLSYEKWD